MPSGIVYCVVSQRLAPDLYEVLRAWFRDDPSVEVVIERRGARRRTGERRRETSPRPPPLGERRAGGDPAGRRIGERRAELGEVARRPPLPPEVAGYADRLRFLERRRAPSLQREDSDTARLVSRIQAGERHLFDELYLRYFDRVYAYLRITLQDPHEAEDLAQDVFVTVYRALPQYERRAVPFRAWLFRIVRNTAINRLRKNRRLITEDPQGVAARREQSTPASEEQHAWIADRDLLAAIERLPLQQRQVIVLRYLLELRHTETAQVLDRTPQAVRKLHQRAIHVLRQGGLSPDDRR